MMIVIEGIDGTGKNTIITGLLTSPLFSGKKVFDLKEYWKSGYLEAQKQFPPHSPSWLRAFYVPPQSLLDEADIIISCEPTYGLIGAAIRGIGLHKESKGQKHHGTYSAESLAQLYALDRLQLREEIIEPSRRAGKIIIQSRCEASTFVYEYMQAKKEHPDKSDEEIVKPMMALEGNALALSCPPEIMFIQYFDDVGLLHERFDGREKDAFENIDFQSMISAYYRSKQYIHGRTLAEFYESLGTRVVFIDAALPKERAVEKAMDVLKNIVQSTCCVA